MGDIEVPQPGASEIVGRLLSEALRDHPDVQWLGLMSEDGFAIASEGAGAVDDDAVAAGAVRMMVQVRGMAKSLGQDGTSQLFLEGGESGICVIDKDPWVLVMVGAPGVPIGLLRYEAREIADAFPMGRRPELPASESAEEPQEQEPRSDENQWWAADVVQEAAEEQPEPEIRWADEQTVDEPADPALDEQQVTDFQDWSVAQPAVEEFDLAPPVAAPDALDTGDDTAFDLAPPVAASDAFDTAFDLAPPVPASDAFDTAFDLAPPVPASDAFDTAFDLAPPADAVPAGFGIDEEEGPQFTGLPEPDLDLADLADLAPPSGPAIELPPPVGPAFELPPPE